MTEEIDIEELRKKIIDSIDMTREPEDEELHNLIDYVIENYANYRFMPLYDRWNIHKKLYDSIRGLGILEDMLADNSISEIMINGIENIFVERNGRIERYEGTFPSNERVNEIIQQIVSRNNKRVNESEPIVDTRLKDGSRICVVMSPVSIDGAAITIRKFPLEQITMDNLIMWDSISKEAAQLLRYLVISGYNIFISGGTGSGKTTFLNALSNYIPQEERIITIEDSAELNLIKMDNVVRMEARQANTEGENEITIRRLIKTSLRMRPDRIIVGEVRGEEAIDMLQAMNTGHDGSMCTGHGNSAIDMISRIETMVLTGMNMPLLAVRKQIGAAIDIIVHLGRIRDKTRRVLEIDELVMDEDGQISMNKLFEFKEDSEVSERVIGKLVATDNRIEFVDKLLAKGILLEQLDKEVYGL